MAKYTYSDSKCKYDVDESLITRKSTFSFYFTVNTNVSLHFNGTFKRSANVVTFKLAITVPSTTADKQTFSILKDITEYVPDWAKCEDVGVMSFYKTMASTQNATPESSMTFGYSTSQEKYRISGWNLETTDYGEKVVSHNFTYIVD